MSSESSKEGIFVFLFPQKKMGPKKKTDLPKVR